MFPLVERLLTEKADWGGSLEGWKYPVLGSRWWLKSECWLLSHVWLCDIMDCSPPGSSVHGILQARILERGAISYSYFLNQELNLCLLCLLHWQAVIDHLGSPHIYSQEHSLLSIQLNNGLRARAHTHTHIKSSSSILDWKILWAEEPGWLLAVGLQRVGHNWASEHYYI